LKRTSVAGPRAAAPLTIAGLHDRAQVFVNGTCIGMLERGIADPSIEIDVPPGGAQIDLLVEALGRVNYGPYLADRKGIVGGVALGQQLLFGWEIFPLPLEDLGGLQFAAARAEGPAFFRGIRIHDYYLRKTEGVVAHEVRHVERLRASIAAGDAILVTPNHPRTADPLKSSRPRRSRLGVK